MERGDLTGAILDGRYRVIEPVAEGAMGIVYRAERVKLGRIVAIKVLHDVLPDELAGRKRFEIEAIAMAKLEHPHCASILDVGVYGARPFVVMDFVSGQNLKELISGGPLPIPRAVEIVRQVLSGLAHAHEHGVIHRDIKPANLVLSHKTGLGDHVKILDFGLARLHDTGQNLTTGMAVGTPAYMAPEQIRGQKIDHRADLYACGVLLFELLTAHKPYHSENDDPIEVCKMHLSDPIPRLDAKLPGHDFGELETVIMKALAKRASKRFASAEEFAGALEAAVGRALRSAGPPPMTSPRQATVPIVRTSPDELSNADSSYPPSLEVGSGDVMSAEPASAEASSAGEPSVRPAGRKPAKAGRRARVAKRPAGADAAPAASPDAYAAVPDGGTAADAADDADPAAAERRARFEAAVAQAQSRITRASTDTDAVSNSRAHGIASPAGTDDAEQRVPVAPPAAAVNAEPRARVATPLAGTETVGDRRARVATPLAGAEAVGAHRARVATPLAGTEAVLGDRRARVATPPAGAAAAGRARASSSTEAITSEEAPGAETVGTFLGMVVTRTPVSAPRAIPAPPDVLPDGAADRSTPAKRRRRWLRTASIVGTVVLAVAAAVALIATRESAPAPGALGADTAVRLPGSGSDIVARANELAAQGDKDGALDLLLRAHRQAPDSAGLSYAAGRIYFSKYHWSDGLRSFREAIRLDPSYRSDPELIKTVLRGFVLTPSYNDDLAAFLHDDIGDAVRPMLEETARSHPNASIRTRATNELRRYH